MGIAKVEKILNQTLSKLNEMSQPDPEPAPEPEPIVTRITSLTATPQSVSTEPSELYGWTAMNPNEEAVYLKFFNHASPTVGTTTPFCVVPIPAGDGVNPGIYEHSRTTLPYRTFSTALSVATVTGIADSANTAPTTPVYLELIWS